MKVNISFRPKNAPVAEMVRIRPDGSETVMGQFYQPQCTNKFLKSLLPVGPFTPTDFEEDDRLVIRAIK
jgi:hypothetical protein